MKNQYFDRDKFFIILFSLLTTIYIIILCLPIASIVRYSGISSILITIQDSESLSAIKLSLETSLVSLFFTFFLGTPTAFFITLRKKLLLTRLIDLIIEIPITLPPAAAGIALLLAFGKNGILGGFFSRYNIQLTFTPTAVVLSQFFVSSIYYIQVLKTSLETVPIEIFEASYVLGCGKVETAIRVIIPMLKKSVISGLILTWIRSMGEFGATIVFAGNVMNKTTTMPLLIYTFMQTNIAKSAAFSLVLYIISFIILFLIKTWCARDD
ncbi:ABC transporter permease [Clostridium felsineum]|uniref:Sulfate transport system permease protein CysW n=1 Tax=Clostridium felsineum TaxID=36839 RepID=A0A1S8LPG3_9CLOT|nr:ABC transporter permease [Clostridium felsineum]URZ02440.1 Sulfate transport system permease protein CysW [Clostridium felsineum]URZ04820.1 Sulfate transport system permease protein CysW [Clostridium felsineum]URZ09861.1 Sulfate transport system permease protein CysW [Clostridium felsineum]URZ18230.1 Sulfate transport system permease protein CysW [Clostridium felsineum DSM 794]